MPTSVSIARVQVDWRKVGDEYRNRDFATLAEAACAVANAGAEALAEVFEEGLDDDAWARAHRATVDRALAAAAAAPVGLPVMAAYVYGLCLKRWELTVDYGSIRRVADAAWATVHAAHGAVDGAAGGTRAVGDAAQREEETDDQRQARLLLTLAVSLGDCMDVENALNCSCPVGMHRHAAAAARTGAGVLAEAQTRREADGDGPYSFICQLAGAQSVYFGAVTGIADAVGEFIDDRQASVTRLRSAVDQVRRAEESAVLIGDVYESELRSHRATLEAMLTLTEVPELRVDEGRVIYCYPFALLDIEAAEVAEQLDALTVGDLVGRALVTGVGPMDVDDAWDTTDPEGRSYGGVAVTLADLDICTTADYSLPAHRVELRATSIGTCYLRIWAPLRNETPHDVNQAMRRGTVHMGAEVIQQDLVTWARLSDYVDEVIAAVERLMRASHPTARTVVSVQRSQHTVISLRKVSLVGPSGVRGASHFDELETALGARLFDQRINHASSTLEEYIRLPSTHRSPVLRDVGFDGEVIVRSPESTVIIMPTTPSFVVGHFEDMAEFSAALPVLVDKWNTALYEQRRALRGQLPTLDSALRDLKMNRATAETLTSGMQRLEDRQARLQDAIADAQSVLAYVRSPALSKTAKYREILDSLFEAAGLARFERDLEVQIGKVEALFRRVQDLGRRLDERLQRRYQLLVEVTLAFLAVTSLADFFALVNDGFGRHLIFAEVGTVLLVGLVVVLVAARSSARRRT